MLKKLIKSESHIIFLILACICIHIFISWPANFGLNVVQGDDRHCYFINKLHDPSLFPNDGITDVYLSSFPLGVTGVLFLLTTVISLYNTALLLPLIILIICTVLIYKIGIVCGDKLFAFMLSIIFLLVYSSSEVGGFRIFPPVFGFIFVLLFLYYTVKNNFWKALSSVFCSIIFYPRILGILLLSACSYLFKAKLRIKTEKGQLILFAVFCLIGVLGLSQMVLNNSVFAGKNYKDSYSRNSLREMPELGRYGWDKELGESFDNDLSFISSAEFLYEQILYIDNLKEPVVFFNFSLMLLVILFCLIFNLFEHRIVLPAKSVMSIFVFLTILISNCYVLSRHWIDSYGAMIWAMLIFFIAMLILYKKQSIEIPRILILMLFWGFGMFIIISILPIKLTLIMHERRRQLAYVLPLTLIFLSVYNFRYKLWAKLKKNKALLLFTMIFSFLFMILYFDNFRLPAYSAVDKNLYNFISGLPKDAVIVENPEQSDYIPFFTKRQIFVSKESSWPFIKNRWEGVKARTFDYFNAFYAENYQEFMNFCNKYDANDLYFIVHESYFDEEYLNGKSLLYFQPFDTYIRRITKKKNFYLMTVPDNKKIFKSKGVYILRCRDL